MTDLEQLAADNERAELCEVAESAAQGLLKVYMQTKNRALAKQCRKTIDALCVEFGCESERAIAAAKEDSL